MRSFRRVTQRVAPALASLASVLLFATCDFDKISGTPAPLTQQDIDRLFSITPTDTTIILGGTTTLNIAPGAGIDLTGTTKAWSSSAPGVVAITEATGVATGVTIGNAVITARVIAPELDSGYSRTRTLRVRYKAIKACGIAPVCSPSALDSIAGLNQSRPVSFFGTNNSDVRQTTALTGVTVSTRDSGTTTNTVASVTGTNVFARKNGAAYVIGVFENMRDSIKVRVRQVAKSLTFPTTEYTANAINANRTLPITMRDINDSVMTESPRLRYSVSDTSVVSIDSITGVLRVKKKDTARIFVRVDTILNRSQKLVVQQLTASLTKFTADPRNDTVARTTLVVPTVTALDSGSTPVAGDTITFRSGLGRSLLTDSVRITDANGRATMGSWKVGDTVGTYTVIASSRFATTTFTTTGLPQRAFGLRFTAQASDTAANAGVATVRVTVVDSLGNLVPTATTPVTVALANNPGSATLNGTKTVSAVNGVATFTGLSLTAVGSGYTLTANATGLSNAISDAFSIYGAPAKLVFLQQPTNVTVNNNFSPVIRVAIQDANGTTVKNATNTIGVSLSTNPGGAAFTGQPSVVAVGGIATFTTLSLNSVANNYGITAASPGLTSAVSNLFNVRSVGTAVKLAFIQQPTNIASSAGMTPALTVEVQDADGARVTTSSAAITLSLIAGTSVGTLSSTSGLTQNASSGVATFSNVTVDKAGSGYTLRATNASLSPATSIAFNVTPGAVTKLGFIVQPTHTNPGVVISPAIQVAAQDAAGNTVPTAGPFNIAMTSSGGTLGGTTTRASVNGIATWDNLTLAAAASGLTLTATATGSALTVATSTFFNVVAASGGASKLRWFTSPANNTAGSTLTNVSVEVVDAGGARVTSATPQIFLTVASGPGFIAGSSTTTMNAVSGLATFTNVQLQTAGTYTLNGNAPGFPAVASNSFTISAGSVNNIGFAVQPPATASSGAAISPAIQVAVRDAFNNVVTTATNSITLAFSTSPAGATLAGTATKAAVAGIATFDNLSTIPAGSYRFQATTACCTTVFSDFFQVAAGTPTTLVWDVQPSNVVAGSAIAPAVKVQLKDASGNLVTTATNPVTIALSGGDATATLGGTKTQTPVSGVATFSDLAVNKIATGYRLNASAAGFSTIQSNTFNGTVGPASKVVFTVQPTNKTGGETFTIKAAIADAQGNIVTGDTRNIGIFIVNGTGTSGATLNGNTFIPAVNGEATFTNVSVDKAGTGYQLTAFASGLNNATSDAFDIAIGTASKLTFTVQPPAQTLASAVITPAVEVSVTDAGGNLITGRTDAITISKTSGTGHFQAVLGGTLTKSAVNGTAVFNNLTLDKSASFYRLTAVATGLDGTESNNFQITAGAASKVTITSQPTNVTSGADFTVNAQITDAGGNPPSSGAIQSITAAILSGPLGANLSGTLTQASNSNGDASFNNLKLDKSGTYVLRFTAGALTAGQTTNIVVQAGQATSIIWGQQPTNTFLNAPMGGGSALPTLIWKDAAGNTVDNTNFPNSNNFGRISIVSGPTTQFKGGFTSFDIQAGANGVATFPTDKVLDQTGSYTLAVANNNCCNAGITAPPNSNAFTVAAFGTKAKLGFVQQPDNTGYGVRVSPAITVAVQDQWDNTVTTATDAITLAIANDAGGGTTLTGGSTSAVGGTGIATFNNVTLNKFGNGFTVTASSGALTAATSNSFNVFSPGIVTVAPNNVHTFLVIGTDIYYSDVVSGAIRKVSTTGGTAVDFATGEAGVEDLATDGTNLYWISTTFGNVKRLALASPGGTPTVVTTSGHAVPSSGVTQDLLEYDAATGNLFFIAGNNIKRVLASATTTAPSDWYVGTVVPWFTIDAGTAYIRTATTAIRKLATSAAPGAATTAVISGLATTINPNGRAGTLRVIGGHVFWSDGSQVITVPTGGGSATVRISGLADPLSMTSDGTTLWFANGSNEVRKYTIDMSSSGWAVTTVGSSLRTVALDASSVYYTQSSGSEIRKVAK